MAEYAPEFMGNCRSRGHQFRPQSVLLLFILVVLFLHPVLAASQAAGNVSSILWEKTIGQHVQGEGHAVIMTGDRNSVITGSVTGSDGIPHLFVVMSDSDGNVLWEYDGGSGTYEGNSLVQAPDNGFIVAGSAGNGIRDGLLLLKLDASGKKEWDKTFGAGTSGQANAVGITSDEGYVLVGSAQGDDATGWDGYILKTNDQGNEDWSRFFKGSKNDVINAIVQTPDDGFIAAGTTASFGAGDNDTFLIKLNAHGDEEWFTTFGGQGDERGIALSPGTGGEYTLARSSCSPGGVSRNCNVAIIRTDSQGKEMGRTDVPVPDLASGTAFTTSSDGSHTVVVSAEQDNHGQTAGKILLTVLDATGTVLSREAYSSQEGLKVSGIAGSGGSYIITGSGTGASAGNVPVMMLIRTSAGTTGIQAPPQTTTPGAGDLRVTVRESDTRGIAGNALVYLDGTAAGLTSDSEGDILLQHVSKGGHSVRVTRDGFAETTKTVEIEGNQNLTVFLSPSKVIPLLTHGPPEEKIDIVFVPSKTQYDCSNQQKVTTDTYTSNRALFQQDVNNLISDEYLSLDKVTSGAVGLPSDYKDRFNFYYYWDKDNFADAFDGCSGTLPDHFWENAPFADVAIIVYPTYVGRYTGAPCEPNGCANGMGAGTHSWFKIPANSGRLFLHESGHVVFGLLDTYCGDTYYTENDPFPNVWSSETACSRSATDNRWNSSACEQLTGAASTPGGAACSKQFWRYDPEPDIMGFGAYSYLGSFGEASTTRIRYILNNIEGKSA
jgi:hypothetical protein